MGFLTLKQVGSTGGYNPIVPRLDSAEDPRQGKFTREAWYRGPRHSVLGPPGPAVLEGVPGPGSSQQSLHSLARRTQRRGPAGPKNGLQAPRAQAPSRRRPQPAPRGEFAGTPFLTSAQSLETEAAACLKTETQPSKSKSRMSAHPSLQDMGMAPATAPARTEPARRSKSQEVLGASR